MSVWTLNAAGEFLGTLNVTAVDRPWMFAAFHPAPAFERWRPLFEAHLESLNDVDRDMPEQRDRRGFDSALQQFVLLAETGSIVVYEDLHIRGDRAWWRLR